MDQTKLAGFCLDRQNPRMCTEQRKLKFTIWTLVGRSQDLARSNSYGGDGDEYKPTYGQIQETVKNERSKYL